MIQINLKTKGFFCLMFVLKRTHHSVVHNIWVILNNLQRNKKSYLLNLLEAVDRSFYIPGSRTFPL